MNNLYYRLLKESQREKLSINKKTLLKVKKLYEEESKKLISKLNNANEMNSQYINSYLEYVNKELKSLSKLKNYGEMTNSTLNYMLSKLNEYERY